MVPPAKTTLKSLTWSHCVFQPEKKKKTYFKNSPQKSLVYIIDSYASRENYFQQYTLSLHQGFPQQYYSTETLVAVPCDLSLLKLSYLKD